MGEYQPSCPDSGCPDCLGDFVVLDGFHGEAVLVTLVQNVINQLPSTAAFFNLTQNFGHVTYSQLDKNLVGPNKGMVLSFYIRFVIFVLHVYFVHHRNKKMFQDL